METPAKGIFVLMQELMVNLYSRWLSEHSFEDFEDYAKVMEKHLSETRATFLKATKRPFGFLFEIDGCTYKVSINRRNYSYKRIK